MSSRERRTLIGDHQACTLQTGLLQDSKMLRLYKNTLFIPSEQLFGFCTKRTASYEQSRALCAESTNQPRRTASCSIRDVSGWSMLAYGSLLSSIRSIARCSCSASWRLLLAVRKRNGSSTRRIADRSCEATHLVTSRFSTGQRSVQQSTWSIYMVPEAILYGACVNRFNKL